MVQITMPQLGESVTEGTILKWLKQPGERIELDDSLCEIETEKVTAELPSPYAGVMGPILVPEGETVEVGVALCELTEVDAGASAKPPASAGNGWGGGPMAIPADEKPAFPEVVEQAVETATAPVRLQVAATEAPAAGSVAVRDKPDDRGRFYSPAVMRLAREHSVDLAAISGTGIGGRVTRRDVDAYLARPPVERAPVTPPARPAEAQTAMSPSVSPASPGNDYTVIEFNATRRRIAENLKRSVAEAPQAWTMVEADVTGLVRLRAREKERFAAQEGVDLTLLPYFTAAVCECLREFPMLNSRWEGDELRSYRALNIGIAVAASSGLVVPVIHDAGDLNIAGLARRIADLAARAHARKLRLDDIEGGTFTVNNTGAFGSIASQPIVNYPQVGIVTMERVVKRTVVRDDDAIAVRSMVNICLSFDHRAMDGLEAGGFLAALKRRLEAIA